MVVGRKRQRKKVVEMDWNEASNSKMNWWRACLDEESFASDSGDWFLTVEATAEKGQKTTKKL